MNNFQFFLLFVLIFFGLPIVVDWLKLDGSRLKLAAWAWFAAVVACFAVAGLMTQEDDAPMTAEQISSAERFLRDPERTGQEELAKAQANLERILKEWE